MAETVRQPDLKLLQQANAILTKCGRTVPPPGTTYVDFYHGYFYQVGVPDQTTVTEPKEVAGDTDFYLRAIQCFPPQGFNGSLNATPYFQIQLPDGRFLQQVLRIYNEDMAQGSCRFVLDEELRCPPGSKFYITTDQTIIPSGTGQLMGFLFEGVHRYYLVETPPAAVDSKLVRASKIPRYLNNVNQNIMAPEWVAGGCGPVPAGKTDELYTYVGTAVLTMGVASAATVTMRIPISRTSDFLFAVLFQSLAFAGGSFSTLYVRIRDSSGYLFTDDFVDINNIIRAPYAKNWFIKRGSTVYIDIAPQAPTGPGTVTVTLYMQGLRRTEKGVAA